MCVFVCVCVVVVMSVPHVDVLDVQRPARKDHFYRMPHRHGGRKKKVIDANAEGGRAGNRANQLIKHFIRLVKPCGNFTASSDGERSPFSASADNAVSPF